MAHLRHMKPGRGPASTWFFVYSIPQDLRGHPRFMTSRGKPMTKITESLGTKDPDKAREARDQRVVYWGRQFRMMREGPSEEDIREEAIEVYRATLKAEAARPAGWGYRPPRDYSEKLDNEIAVHVRKEIAAYCERSGVFLEPGTQPWRKVGVEFLKAKIAAGGWGAMMPLPDGRWLRSDEQHLPPLPKIESPDSSEPKPVPPPSRRTTEETFSEALEKYLSTGLEAPAQTRLPTTGARPRCSPTRLATCH